MNTNLQWRYSNKTNTQTWKQGPCHVHEYVWLIYTSGEKRKSKPADLWDHGMSSLKTSISFSWEGFLYQRCFFFYWILFCFHFYSYLPQHHEMQFLKCNKYIWRIPGLNICPITLHTGTYRSLLLFLCMRKRAQQSSLTCESLEFTGLHFSSRQGYPFPHHGNGLIFLSFIPDGEWPQHPGWGFLLAFSHWAQAETTFLISSWR